MRVYYLRLMSAKESQVSRNWKGKPFQQKTMFWTLMIKRYVHLGGGFKYFLCSPLFGEDSHFDWYFSDGLKPPTSHGISMFWCLYESWVDIKNTGLSSKEVNLQGMRPRLHRWRLLQLALQKYTTCTRHGYEVVSVPISRFRFDC